MNNTSSYLLCNENLKRDCDYFGANSLDALRSELNPNKAIYILLIRISYKLRVDLKFLFFHLFTLGMASRTIGVDLPRDFLLAIYVLYINSSMGVTFDRYCFNEKGKSTKISMYKFKIMRVDVKIYRSKTGGRNHDQWA